jgi:hypothetical protein
MQKVFGGKGERPTIYSDQLADIKKKKTIPTIPIERPPLVSKI